MTLVIKNELALFQPAAKERAVSEVDWVEYRPVSQLSSQGAIEFQISGTSSEYVLLSKTRLHIKLRLLKPDGSPVDPTDEVALTNLSLHSLFRQVDLSLNQQVIAPTVGVNYPYKAMLDVLLNCNHGVKDSLLAAEGYYKDVAFNMESTTENTGYVKRKKLTEFGITDLESILHIDLAQMDRAILNGVMIGLKLFQSTDSFRIFAPDSEQYTVEITDAILKVCHLKLNPAVILAHNEQIKKTPGIYPYWRSEVKAFSIPSGSYLHDIDDMFHGLVPNKLFVTLTSSEAYSGNYSKNPFNFHHFDLNFLQLAVDGRSVPTVAFQPHYQRNPKTPGHYLPTGYTNEFLSLFKNEYPQAEGNWIERSDYGGGYAVYCFNTRPNTGDNIYSKTTKGHTRLSVRFATELPIPVTLIAYGQFCDEFKIDHTRNILT